jgi:hypothetical protein
MSTSLAVQQQTLLDALFSWPPENAIKTIASYADDTGARGLKAYQTNGHMLAERALKAAYPVIAQMLGQDSFGDLARALWHDQPPSLGDIAQWGSTLHAYIRASDQLQDEPYLPDVAKAEWALHCCASAADTRGDMATLALLTTHDPTEVCMNIAEGWTVVQSEWPLASLLSAHLEHRPSFAEVGQQLQAGVAQDVLVWRCGLRPRVRETMAGEAAFLQKIQQGCTLDMALQTAPSLDIGTWLPLAVQEQLLVSVHVASAPLVHGHRSESIGLNLEP